jgi:uncharacterized membrane protein YbhN (UPF0104 family)
MRRSTLWRAAAALVGIAVVVLVLARALGGGSELTRALRLASAPAGGWLALAAGCEAVSYLAYATAQRRLVGAAGHRLGLGWLTSLAVCAQAMNNFLPAGYLAANVFNFRQFRRAKLTPGATGWVLLATTALNIGALCALALLGSAISGDGGSLPLFIFLGVAALTGALWAGRRLYRPALARLPDRVRSTLAELGRVRLSPRSAALAAGLLAVCWLADASCLVTGFLAVGARPPWAALLLAYSVAQLLSFLPLTPGGLGVVEGSLTVGLATGGVGLGHVLAAVLIYRLLSYWATLPLGALGYANVRRAESRGERPGTLGWVWPLPNYATRSSVSR